MSNEGNKIVLAIHGAISVYDVEELITDENADRKKIAHLVGAALFGDDKEKVEEINNAIDKFRDSWSNQFRLIYMNGKLHR